MLSCAEKIIGFLKKTPTFVSGEQIAQALRLSRQALWQEINELRDAGYDILAVPHVGYRLIALPDRLYPRLISDGLTTRVVGRSIYYVERCYSTMDIARELAQNQSGEGTLVVAETQTKGRGRLGRQWLSPKYKGIYCSLILKPDLSAGSAAILTLVTAVAACEAIKKQTGIQAQIKWPNDIVIGTKKLGGILTELRFAPDKTSTVVIGIGLNVNNAPGEVLHSATSLKICARPHEEHINRIALLQELLKAIEENYCLLQKKGSSPILDKWKACTITLGKKVRVVLGQKHVEGEAVGIDARGALKVRRQDGKVEKFTAGDIVHLRTN